MNRRTLKRLEEGAPSPSRAIATQYVAELAETNPHERLVDLKVTQKGGAPAQTLKRIILSRLATAPHVSQLAHFKRDTYACRLSGSETKFRFAVTATPDTLPWFNITFAELEQLAAANTILLIIWNPTGPTSWCRSVRVFCIPPHDVLLNLQTARVEILHSLLCATIIKAERETWLPQLQSLIREKARHIPQLQPSQLTVSGLESLSTSIATALAEFETKHLPRLDSATALKAKHATTKLREKLVTVLLRIHPSSVDRNFSLTHDKTHSTLLVIGTDLTTEVPLGDEESRCLISAYGGGIEIEEDDSPSTDLIEHPYDPTKTQIDTRSITVDLLVRRIKHDEIDLNPAFQRKAGLWSQKQKSQLIESLLIRIPLPSFYFDATDDSRWLVVDGLQRLVAFRDFLLHDMPLEGLEYLAHYGGTTFSNLPRPLRRAIEESQVTIHLIQPGTPPEVKFNIFRRVNTGGLVLTPQEIRHALNQGPVVQFLARLATSAPFMAATMGSVPTDRMTDREFVLRFLAFSVTPYTDYKTPDTDAFLSTQMGRLNSVPRDYETLERAFDSAMNRAAEIFGKHAFRKLYDLSQARSPINKALFETWSVNLGRLSEAHADVLLKRRAEVLERSIALNKDEGFNTAISASTADVRRVRRRFSAVQALIDTVLEEGLHAHEHDS